jgi:hypothetical protein
MLLFLNKYIGQIAVKYTAGNMNKKRGCPRGSAFPWGRRGFKTSSYFVR